ncbi:MAG: 1-deoxy-D-xylulose-5-phosphate synthase [Magnetococcales bacterium]|nr:1-deoxy-D-xylulose-5-phosphate synthase [Magnetococcales bacterium]
MSTDQDTLLKKIRDPRDLREIAESSLPGLAEEIRSRTIDVVSQTGGHLGAGLGVVELTIALHYVFNTPSDRLIWDVGHQCYPHKILTGRNDRMPTLRKRHGLSGFTKRNESPYDPFGAGHSSTSISAALGMAMAARHKEDDRFHIAVIGDGALSAGMAFEALNNAGHIDDIRLLVILNDNEMSISPNVGAMSSYLSRILSGPLYTSLREGTGRVLGKISSTLSEAAMRAEEHVKGMITPGTLFEELGFTYFGPLDGHDFQQLLPTLRNIRDLKGPVLLHVNTQKGKGFAPAEHNPCTYHGVSPFDRQTGEIHTSNGAPPSFTKVFADQLIELAQKDSRVVAITAAMPEGTGLNHFEERFPARFFDVGIAEQHAVTFAAGLACEGLIPVVAIYSTFIQRGFDQIVHDVVLQKLPVVFALDRAGLVGADGATHAGVFDISFLRSLPGMVIMAPSDEQELRDMLATAIELERPVAIRYPRGSSTGMEASPATPISLGLSRRLRKGTDLAIVAIGHPALAAKEAADILGEEGISVSVYDARFAKPMDEQMLREAATHPWLITLEENAIQGGFGSAVLEFLVNQDLINQSLKVRNLGLPDRFIPHGSQDQLRHELKIDSDGLAEQIRELIGAPIRTAKAS